jgi:hypothetical protein
MASKQKVVMELSDDQLENIRGVFNHFDWDFDSAVISDSNSLVNAETQTDSPENDYETNNIDEFVNEPFRIQQDPNSSECIYCFCRPCITDEVNRQMWWETEPHPKHKRNRNLRKEKYKRFWTMMYHREIWDHPRYVEKKRRALEQDPRFRNLVWPGRDIIPDCVIKCVRGWFPNPDNIPYVGHLWE